MNQPRDKERLLADVLADESAAGFRETLLSEPLGLVRRRRRARQAWRAAWGLALVAALGVLVWRSLPPTAVAPGTEGRGYAVVVSRPLPPTALVVTRPFAADRIHAPVGNTQIVQTASSRESVREIDDIELLELVAPKPAALVRLAPHSAELVFINPADEEELFQN
jgi:hypothetical protein